MPKLAGLHVVHLRAPQPASQAAKAAVEPESYSTKMWRRRQRVIFTQAPLARHIFTGTKEKRSGQCENIIALQWSFPVLNSQHAAADSCQLNIMIWGYLLASVGDVRSAPRIEFDDP